MDDTRLHDIQRVLERIGYYADADTLREVEKELADLRLLRAAAQAWWQNKRPCVWELWEHMHAPTVNCVTQCEDDLARAVAAIVAKENGK